MSSIQVQQNQLVQGKRQEEEEDDKHTNEKVALKSLISSGGTKRDSAAMEVRQTDSQG